MSYTTIGLSRKLNRVLTLRSLMNQPVSRRKKHYPATIKFHLHKGLHSKVGISSVLPPPLEQESLPYAKVAFTEGGLGYLLSQQVHYPEWVIAKLYFQFEAEVTLRTTTNRPMVSILCMLEGGVFGTLNGNVEIVLPQYKFGFLYIAPEVNNTIRFHKGRYRILYISISPGFLSGFMSQYLGLKEIHDKQIKGNKIGEQLPFFPFNNGMEIIDKMRDPPPEASARKLFYQNRVNELLLLYFAALKEPKDMAVQSGNKMAEKLRQVEAHIAKHYNKPLGIEKLAADVNMNLTTFERQFKKIYGRSPKEYILFCRMREAAKLLRETDLQVSEIGFQVGFAGANYFSKLFKKYNKLTPLEYRRNGSLFKGPIDENV